MFIAFTSPPTHRWKSGVRSEIFNAPLSPRTVRGPISQNPYLAENKHETIFATSRYYRYFWYVYIIIIPVTIWCCLSIHVLYNIITVGKYSQQITKSLSKIIISWPETLRLHQTILLFMTLTIIICRANVFIYYI